MTKVGKRDKETCSNMATLQGFIYLEKEKKKIYIKVLSAAVTIGT